MSIWKRLTGTGYRTYDHGEVETFLRKWPFLDDEPSQYDFVGAMHLLLAILDNLSTYSVDADLETFCEFGAVDEGGLFTRKQREFLKALIKADAELLNGGTAN